MKMASAQALPSSWKQEHLEARKRQQLEEFRKEKAAEKAKKSESTPKPMFLMLA
ncbi:hypothetical protein PVK06_002055 [Gossypium arboreum]|uniref:Uncharacterized protein n=1 Tax=Gossypium arboreum TaxID=29729 RepID=A0ABR0R2W8_GOSAR|nr:hypothetical protein PVK06_002055 [Gossypium arboreum]